MTTRTEELLEAKPMTVAQLIAKLQTLPADLTVVIMNADGEDEGNLIEVVGPNDELPNAVYLQMDASCEARFETPSR